MSRSFFLITSALFFMCTFAQARTISVSGQGDNRGFCNANAGSFCIDGIKRNAERDANDDARRACEFGQRGRALTYTASYSSFCSPNILPPNHDGTWVSCRSNSRMQCEVNN